MCADVLLPSLFADFPLEYNPGVLPRVQISGIAIDSRKVKAGDLFIARRGGAADGHDYIPSALEHGAAAVVGERDLVVPGIPYIRVPNSVEAVSWLAAAFHGWPGRKLTVIGVTGTDGKTTTCNILQRILVTAGIKSGMISTVNALIGEEVLDTGFHVTTPDAQDVQAYLARMVQTGLTHVILETTSHGLAQHRVDAALYDLGVVTNITHEHLDQHGSYENYAAAKARLFTLLKCSQPKPNGPPRLAILNRDDASYDTLTGVVRGLGEVGQVSYGLDISADVRAVKIQQSPAGLRFEAASAGFRVPVSSPLAGIFNVSNCLAALATAVCGLGIDPLIAARGLTSMAGIPGRMEAIELGQAFTAIVDFAHTPNALRAALETARNMTHRGRVIAIFGSAGLRDRQKRRMMAECSAELADISIFTAEDPRGESLEAILDEMAEGAREKGGKEGRTFFSVADRAAAIRLGVRQARPGDVVIACGKGHEQSMCFGSVEYPWDDRTAMRAALAELLKVYGPKMPELPTRNQ